MERTPYSPSPEERVGVRVINTSPSLQKKRTLKKTKETQK